MTGTAFQSMIFLIYSSAGYKGAKGGFGFGLAIASHAARSMNATLRAENRAEGGACFTLSF